MGTGFALNFPAWRTAKHHRHRHHLHIKVRIAAVQVEIIMEYFNGLHTGRVIGENARAVIDKDVPW